MYVAATLKELVWVCFRRRNKRHKDTPPTIRPQETTHHTNPHDGGARSWLSSLSLSQKGGRAYIFMPFSHTHYTKSKALPNTYVAPTFFLVEFVPLRFLLAPASLFFGLFLGIIFAAAKQNTLYGILMNQSVIKTNTILPPSFSI